MSTTIRAEYEGLNTHAQTHTYSARDI